MTRAVIDTNVLVSGLLSSGGPPSQLVDALFARKLQPVFSDSIIAEYRAVLARAKFRFDTRLTTTLLHGIEAVGDYLPDALITAAETACSDPDDQVFLDCAYTAECCLITGNRKHFPEYPPITILSPRQAVDQWGGTLRDSLV